ncbi:hypothetical protein BC827DRAFT_924222 [Russula dissimulans]|nr:hypothetical protein BC827DRAFT_924222 [Russula dissimulans]
MPVDTVVDLRQRAGDLAHRLGSLSHFMPAAQELLEIIHCLTSEILLRHNRKIVTLVEISRATLTRAGLRLNSFTSFIPALRNYKALYFEILRALQQRQEVIIDSDNLRDRVSRLLKPLSTWIVMHQRVSTSAPPLSAPQASPDRDSAFSPSPGPSQQPRRNSLPTRRRSDSESAHPSTAPEELMPPPSSLPHRFQQPPSTTPRGWHSGLLVPPTGDHHASDQTSGAIRMARTRSPRPLPVTPQPGYAELEPENNLARVTVAEPPEMAALPPVLAQRMTQRFGIFCTTANGSGVRGRRRGLTVPRSTP